VSGGEDYGRANQIICFGIQGIFVTLLVHRRQDRFVLRDLMEVFYDAAKIQRRAS
jgi:hypothetical protein